MNVRQTSIPQLGRQVLLGGVFCLAACASAGCAAAPSPLAPRGPAAEQLATLWWVLFAIALVVFVVVMGLLAYALFRSRTRGASRLGDGRLFVTIGGGLIPALILVAVMIYTVSVQNAISMPKEANFTVQVIGHKWWWEVHYPAQGFATANEIHVPVGVPVVLKLTSADVIHSFWAPQLQAKMDMLPGQTNTTWFTASQPGTYRVECAEYCGLQHAHMMLLIIAQPQDQLAAWIQGQQQEAARPSTATLQQGEQIFLGSACVYCHTIRGTIASGQIGPDLTHLASRQTIGAGVLPNNTGSLGGWIINSQSIKPGNQMPPMYLNGDELQSLLAYLESLK